MIRFTVLNILYASFSAAETAQFFAPIWACHQSRKIAFRKLQIDTVEHLILRFSRAERKQFFIGVSGKSNRRESSSWVKFSSI